MRASVASPELWSHQEMSSSGPKMVHGIFRRWLTILCAPLVDLQPSRKQEQDNPPEETRCGEYQPTQERMMLWMRP